MSKRKMRGAFLLALLVLVAVPLAGCHSGEDFPIYQMETWEDDTEILYIDGVEYQRDSRAGRDELARYYSDGDQYVWTPAGGIGEQIGVYGKDADKGYGFSICEIAGDEARTFLYTTPRKFYFGGVDSRLWMRDGVTLGTPTAETVSSVTLIFENEDSTSVQVDDPAMIAALLEAYSGDSVPVPDSEDWVYGSLIMHHKDFPFLQYEIECRCSLEQGTVCYRTSALGEWLSLSAEWYAVIAEHDFSTQDE